jgi:hypothetical protein
MRTNVKFTYLMLFIAMLVTAMVYWPGLSGSFLFDDYPNILDNPGVQPRDASLASLVRAALSSPSSEFSRPLSSLSFAANYLTTGLNPYWMKLTNLVIHLLNGLLVFFLASALLESATDMTATSNGFSAVPEATSIHAHSGSIALLIAASWMLLPINLTAVLYIVQRMESLANLFVLIGLIGYVAARRRMLSNRDLSPATSGAPGWGDFWLCAASITLPTAFGLLAKETAVMLPFYALLIECFLYGFRVANLVYPKSADPISSKATRVFDRRLLALYFFVLAIPFIAGAVLLLPSLLQPDLWNTRNFTLSTRLLSEARIVIDYVFWTVLPTPHALSFYHDNFNVSSGVLAPWTTLASLLALAGFVVLTWWLRQRLPLTALGHNPAAGTDLRTSQLLRQFRPACCDRPDSRRTAIGAVLFAAPHAAGRINALLDRANSSHCLCMGQPAAPRPRPCLAGTKVSPCTIRTGPNLHRPFEIRSPLPIYPLGLCTVGALSRIA